MNHHTATWQNAPSSPPTTDGFLHDGAGTRVEQLVMVSRTTTWTNPYRYDGRDGVRYDGETGLYWMSVRAYDPALDRFLSRDPLGRTPLFFADQPYVYGGNNPLINVDPSGQFMATEGISNTQAHAMMKARMGSSGGKPPRYSPPAVRLSGNTYTLADALKDRVNFQQDFFKAYAPG